MQHLEKFVKVTDRTTWEYVDTQKQRSSQGCTSVLDHGQAIIDANEQECMITCNLLVACRQRFEVLLSASIIEELAR